MIVDNVSTFLSFERGSNVVTISSRLEKAPHEFELHLSTLNIKYIILTSSNCRNLTII